jgi:hypothetical protein
VCEFRRRGRKDRLANLVKERIGAEHIEGDKFVLKPNKPTPYRDCLRRDEFDAKLAKAIATGRVVIVDAVCLEEVAPSQRWGRGFVVYVKRLSYSSNVPMWHPGLHLEKPPPKNGSAPFNSYLPQRGEAASHRGPHS